MGAVRVIDGLFMGDEYAAQDLEFIMASKITKVVNTAARQIGNLFEKQGLSYLSLPWLSADHNVLYTEYRSLYSPGY